MVHRCPPGGGEGLWGPGPVSLILELLMQSTFNFLMKTQLYMRIHKEHHLKGPRAHHMPGARNHTKQVGAIHGISDTL